MRLTGAGGAYIMRMVIDKGALISPGQIYRKSRARDRILEILKDTAMHPSAETVYEKMRRQFPRISFGTIYRNLTILADQGLVKRIDFAGDRDRFDANLEPHYHFICENCGSVSDLPLTIDGSLNRRVVEETGYRPRNHQIEFFGLCRDCADEAPDN